MGVDVTCPHLSLVLKVSKEALLARSEKPCHVCRKKEKLWACLQESCQFVGCGEKLHDHSTKHYKKQRHAIAVNLNSFRIWCFACEKEVHLTSAFTPSEMKTLKKARKAQKDGAFGADTRNDVQSPPRQSQPVSSEVYHSDMTPPLGLTGLRNMGNTCYMNSALQAISNCPPVTHFFAYHENEPYVDKEQNPSMARSYFNLMIDMWSPNRHPCVAPSEVHSTLKAINPSFRGYHQQDAQEFLRCFMDRLHEELKYIVPKWKYDDEIPENLLEEAAHNEEEPMDIDDDGENAIPMPSARVPDGKEKDSDSFKIISESLPAGLRSGKPSVSTLAGNQESARAQLGQLHAMESSVTEKRPKRGKRLKNQTTKLKMTYQNQQNHPTAKAAYHYRSIISEIFDGELRSSVQCLTCDQVSHTRETFQDLSLPIPGKDDLTRLHSTTGLNPTPTSTGSLAVIPGFKGPCSESTTSWTGGLYDYAWDMWDWFKSWIWGPQVTLSDCLSAFFSADELKGDNMYSCNKCNKLRNGMKYCKLLQLPEVLCIHLKRFRHEYLMSYSSKISSPVTFPITGLDLRRYLAQDSPSTCTNYDLCSIIVHHGNAGGGHYTAYAKNMVDNNWYEYDDQFITKVSESVVANSEAYVLFYQKSNAESSRTRQRILHTLRTDANRLEASQDLLHFFISMSWLNKFCTFAEPGPIDNSDFLCRHSGVLPRVQGDLEFLVHRVSEPLWQKLHERYGGGPAVTRLSECSICEEEYYNLQCRREEERKTFMKLGAEPLARSSNAQVYISLDWFREWEDFLNEKVPDPPGKIDNWPICYTKEGKHCLRKSSSHAPIPRKSWEYLISVYGGGPEVAPNVRAASRSPNRTMKSPRASSSSSPSPMETDAETQEKVVCGAESGSLSTQQESTAVKEEGSASGPPVDENETPMEPIMPMNADELSPSQPRDRQSNDAASDGTGSC